MAGADQLKLIVLKSLLDPDWFCRHVLRSPNDPWQSRLLNAVADLDRVRLGYEARENPDLLQRFSVASCHGTGKTHVAAKVMHWYGFTHPRCVIPATAPKEKQLTTRTWPEFRRLLGQSVADYRKLVDAQQTKVTWGNDPDWAALVEAASQPENLAGYHGRHILFLVEEASGVDEQMFPVVEGALTTEQAVLVLIGNPTKNHGEHHASHNRRGTRERYWKLQLGYQDSPRVSQRWAKEMIAKYGADSPITKVRVLGEWADLDEYQLLTPHWIAEAQEREEERDGTHPTLRVSVDVADGGTDKSVVTVARQYGTRTHLLRQEDFSFPASEAPIRAADAAERMFLAFGGDKLRDDLVVDALGVGAGTAGTLLDRGYRVVQYRGGEASDDQQRWRNRRSQSYLVLRDALRDGWVSFAEDFVDNEDDRDELEAHLLSIKLKPGQERVEDLETKQELLRRGLPSPDRADSVAMQFATQAPTIGSQGSDIPVLFGQLESEGYDV
jgi:hypothetical protein